MRRVQSYNNGHVREQRGGGISFSDDRIAQIVGFGRKLQSKYIIYYTYILHITSLYFFSSLAPTNLHLWSSSLLLLLASCLSAHPSIHISAAAAAAFSAHVRTTSVGPLRLALTRPVTPVDSLLSVLAAPAERPFHLSYLHRRLHAYPATPTPNHPADTASKSYSAIINVQWNKSCVLCHKFDVCLKWGSHKSDVHQNGDVG